jgi:hypothetical protein
LFQLEKEIACTQIALRDQELKGAYKLKGLMKKIRKKLFGKIEKE